MSQSLLDARFGDYRPRPSPCCPALSRIGIVSHFRDIPGYSSRPPSPPRLERLRLKPLLFSGLRSHHLPADQLKTAPRGSELDILKFDGQ